MLQWATSIFLLWPHCAACGISVPRPGIEPGPLAVKARSLNHWIAREFSKFDTSEESSLSIYCAPAQSSLTLCNPMDCSSPGSLFMGFFRQEYWSVLPCPPPGDPPNPGTEPMSPVSQVDSLPAEPLGTPFWRIELFYTLSHNWDNHPTIFWHFLIIIKVLHYSEGFYKVMYLS